MSNEQNTIKEDPEKKPVTLDDLGAQLNDLSAKVRRMSAKQETVHEEQKRMSEDQKRMVAMQELMANEQKRMSEKQDLMSEDQKRMSEKQERMDAKQERMSENWKKFAETHLGSEAKDGKLGKASIAVIGMILLGIVAVAWALEPLADWTAGGPYAAGTAKIEYDTSASDCKLTVDDALINDDLTVTGTLAAGDISMANSDVIVSNLTVKANAAITGTLTQTGIATFGADPVITSGDLYVTNSENAGSAVVHFKSDQGADAADKGNITFADGGAWTFYGTSETNPIVTIGATGGMVVDTSIAADIIESQSAGTLSVGPSTATAVTLGAADAHTTVAGNLLASQIDASTATMMEIGKSTATNVVIADTTVDTIVEGPFIAREDVKSDELDSETATALLLGKSTATGVTIGAADAHTTIAGNLLASQVDAATATMMEIGKSTATNVVIADTAVDTIVEGPFIAREDIKSDELDAETATALLIGKATATSVTIGAADADVSIPGNMTVSGTLTGSVVSSNKTGQLVTSNAFITAGGNIDAQSGATLAIGPSDATKIEIADTSVETEIQGTLDCQEAATFGSTIAFSTNAYVIAGQFANRSALVVNVAVSNAPVGTLILAGPGKGYIKVGVAGETNSYSTITMDNAE